MAQDYDMAIKIREFIKVLEPRADKRDDETVDFLDWAKKKADWFDPVVARQDIQQNMLKYATKL